MNLLIDPKEYMAFDVYFASICSMQVHPGAGSKDHKVLSEEECRDKVFKMLDIRRSVFNATTGEADKPASMED